MPRSDGARPDDAPAVPGQLTALAVEELGQLVKQHRGHQSIRQAAAEAGVSFSTLSRVEAGAQPDLSTFLRLCAWLEVPPQRFFRAGPQRPASTIDEVSSHLFADPRLSAEAAERIAAVVRDLYAALAREVQEPAPLAMHLRAAPVMRPGVPERLAGLLHDVRAALEHRLSEGTL
jgi:transcriptional regulator with XRE-family HTH domain